MLVDNLAGSRLSDGWYMAVRTNRQCIGNPLVGDLFGGTVQAWRAGRLPRSLQDVFEVIL